MKEVPPAKPSIYKLQQYYTSLENSNRFIQKLQTMSNVGYRCTETFDNAESSHHDTIYNIYTYIFVRFMFCRRQCWWDQYELCLDAIYSKVKLRRRYWQEFVCMPFTDANFPCNYRKLSTAWRDWDMNRTLSNQ